jgi:uncharacterized delta-60 repeat protein
MHKGRSSGPLPFESATFVIIDLDFLFSSSEAEFMFANAAPWFLRTIRSKHGRPRGTYSRYRMPLRLLRLEERVTPMAGQLDPSFGTSGLVTTRFPNPSNDQGQSTAIDSLGRIVVAGTTNNGVTSEVAITRYTMAGTLDTSFGGTGIVIIDSAFSTAANGLAIDSLDRIVVGGYTQDATNSDFLVVRFTSVGTLDSSFDNNGKQTIDFGSSQDSASGVAIDSLGRIIIGGTTRNGTNNDFAVCRLTADGALDSSFDGDGKQTIDFGSPSDIANTVAVDSLDRVIVAGYTNNGLNDDFAVARLTTDGTLDSSFNAVGKQTIAFSTSDDRANSVAIDSQDRIVVAGYYMYTPLNSGTKEDFAVARLTTNGSLDINFNTDGKQTINFDYSLDEANSVAIDSLGRIIVAGRSPTSTGTDFAVARLLHTGALDASFDTDGKQTVHFNNYANATSTVTDSLDRIVVAGSASTKVSNNDFAIARLTATGALDTSLDGDGEQQTDLLALSNAVGTCVAEDSAGRTVVAGYSSDGSKFVLSVARYKTTGVLDAAFGSMGMVTIDLGVNSDYTTRVAIDSLDRIVVTGRLWNGSNYDFGIVRLTPAGGLDTSFDSDGIQSVDFGAANDFANGVAVDSLNRIVVVGYTANGSANVMAVARLTAAGALDSSFNSNGKTTISFGTSTASSANSVAVDSFDRIVVAGNAQQDFAIARLTVSGGLDPTFGSGGKQTVDVDHSVDAANGVVIDSLGRFVVAGKAYSDPNNKFAVVRLTGTGALDTSFDFDGKQTIDFGADDNLMSGVAVDSLDRVIVAGYTMTGSNYEFAVARLTSAGALDASFNSDGKQIINFGVPNNTARGLAVDSLDRVVVAGSAVTNGQVFALARLTGDTPPSKLTSIIVNDGTAQRSMVTSLKMTFDSKVSFIGAAASAFQLNRQSDNAAVNLLATVDVSGTFVTLTFTGGAIDLGGSLADGRYTLKILANQFGGLGFDGNGNGLANGSPTDDYAEVGSPTSPNKLFRIFGDANGDGAVAANDFVFFRQSFNSVNVVFDFDGDGSVSTNDFIEFKNRFNTSI